ncbi:MAG: PorV/PorQ family protein [Salibacteraceae bacterium]
MAQRSLKRNKKVYIYTLLFSLFFLSSNFTYAQVKYSNEFLNIGVSARGLGMSNSVVSSTDDVTAGYWNPANLVEIDDKFQVGIMHASYFAGISNYDYGSVAIPVDNGVVGLSVIRFGVDNILNTINFKDPNGNFNYDRITTFSTADYAFLVSYGRKTKIEGLSLGGNFKIIYRQIGDFANAYGFGLDASANYTMNKWKFAVMARDLTTTVNAWSYTLDQNTKDVFEETGNEIPRNGTEITLPKILFGISKEFTIKEKFSILPEIDFDMYFDGRRPTLISGNAVSIDPHMGLELGYNQFLFVRGGIGNIQKQPKVNSTEHDWLMQPNFGVGIRLDDLFGLGNVVLDYALTAIDQTNSSLYSNVFSLRIDVGSFKPAEKTKKMQDPIKLK